MATGAALSSLALFFVPVPRLPKPTGPYAHLGMHSVLHAPQAQRGPATLLRIYYPARENGARMAPFDETGRLGRALAAFGAPDLVKLLAFFLLDHLQLAKMQASEGALLAQEPAGGFPVVVFSHGNGANAKVYSTYLCELASHGCVAP